MNTAATAAEARSPSQERCCSRRADAHSGLRWSEKTTFFSLWSLIAWADILEGRVVGVADGDTIALLDGNRQQHRTRLAGIDAPETAQPYAQRSKQHLAELAFGKDAKADCYKVDPYDRDVCTVYVNEKDIGLAQLDAGLAWWFREYAHEQPPKDRIDYQAAEDRAAADRVGLWQDKKPVPPCKWRHKHR
jgi:endonuclease YncB( thermonuclease family)